MKSLGLWATGAMALLLVGGASSLAVSGCSSDSGDGGSSSGGSTSQGTPPARPSGAATTDTSKRTFAVNTLALGVNDEWKKLGYNIDGKVSTGASKDVCAAAGGAVTSPHQDGNNGIDNAFGAIVLPSLIGIQPDVQQLANQALSNGTFTIMVQTTGLPASPPAELTGMSGQLFAGGKFDETDGGAQPAFNTTTDWPVSPAILKDGATIGSGSKIQFANSYFADGTFVTGDRLTVTLNLNLGGVDLALSVHNAVITMKPSGSDMNGGIISGFLVTSEVSTALKQLGGRLSLSFCGAAVDTFIENLTAASDLLSDGQTDGSRTCDAISIGLGFTAKEIANPTKVGPAPAGNEEDPCNAPAPTGDSGTL